MLIRLLFAICISSVTMGVMAAEHKYAIKFSDDGLLYYNGELDNLRATNPKLTNNNKKFNARSPASKAYSAHLKTVMQERMEEIQTAIGSNKSSSYHFKAIYHGVAMQLTDDEVAKIRALPNVKSVEILPVHQLDTERGPRWIKAHEIWEGTAVPSNAFPGEGAGIIIGVIDTGINTDHPSFAEVGPVDGYVHNNPLGDGNFVGHCIGGDNDGIPPPQGTGPDDPPNAEVPCNNKLIGAWGLTDATDTDAPEDNNGHGSHTASTSGGNHWAGPFFEGNANANILLDQISGVAPHANIIAYDVCEASTCSSVIEGVDRAILDGVDVINFSISGGNSPWVDTDRAFLDAVNANIFVAASAGNTRAENVNPIADTSHDGPWVMTVANSSHDRDGTRTAGNFAGGDTAAPADVTGQSNTGNFGPATVVYAGDFVNPGETEPEQCLVPFPAGTWTNGEIVVCDRGAIARVAKGVNVLSGGAGGMILANIDGGADSVVPDFHVLPAVHMDNINGNAIKAWLTSGTGHLGEIINMASSGGNSAIADIISGSSLRGPNLSFDVTKPNITAPGTAIAAAFNDNLNTTSGSAEIGIISGTSMSSPHIAGSGALMKMAHPNWSVPEIKSAIMMTADKTGRKEDNLTPTDHDDVGSGRVDMSKAAMVGLVMDETFDNFLAANPAAGGDPSTLNVPSVRNSTCGTSCSWTRTLKHKLNSDSSWTLSTETDGTFTLDVSPLSFDMVSNDVIYGDGFDNLPLETSIPQEITITASGVPTVAEGMAFGQIILSDDSGNSPDLHITVSVNQALPYGGTPPPDS